MKLQKGEPGYISKRKQRYLAWTLAEAAVVAGLLIFGYVQTGTKMNLFTVAAVLGCLPAAKMLVEFITMAPHRGIEADKYEEIEACAPLLVRIYDLIITSRERVMPVAAIAISGHVVCGYAPSPKTDEETCAAYLKEMLRTNRYDKMTVKIFHDYKAFLARVEGMNNIASVEQAENLRREEHIKSFILSVSM